VLLPEGGGAVAPMSLGAPDLGSAPTESDEEAPVEASDRSRFGTLDAIVESGSGQALRGLGSEALGVGPLSQVAQEGDRRSGQSAQADLLPVPAGPSPDAVAEGASPAAPPPRAPVSLAQGAATSVPWAAEAAAEEVVELVEDLEAVDVEEIDLEAEIEIDEVEILEGPSEGDSAANAPFSFPGPAPTPPPTISRVVGLRAAPPSPPPVTPIASDPPVLTPSLAHVPIPPPPARPLSSEGPLESAVASAGAGVAAPTWIAAAGAVSPVAHSDASEPALSLRGPPPRGSADDFERFAPIPAPLLPIPFASSVSAAPPGAEPKPSRPTTDPLPGTEPRAAPGLGASIPGEHRVVVHTLEGQVKRGTMRDPVLDGEQLDLEIIPGQPPERLATRRLKAVFFLLPPGSRGPSGDGPKLRVTFSDERQVAGFAPNYRPSDSGFFMIPADTRTNTERIYIYRAAVKNIANG